MKLELGSGTRPTPGYVHQDVRKLPGIDIVCDAQQLPRDIKGKPTEIYVYHMLEHIPWRVAPRAIKHWAEWLAPGGRLKIVSPDFQTLAEWLVANPTDDYIVDRVQYMSQGGQDYPENTHVCMTTAHNVSRWFREAGLQVAQSRRHNNRKPIGEHCPMITVIGHKPK